MGIDEGAFSNSHETCQQHTHTMIRSPAHLSFLFFSSLHLSVPLSLQLEAVFGLEYNDVCHLYLLKIHENKEAKQISFKMPM